tara:strand:- start:5057 stop:6724 length:1668 start_codon:yes stop_codon:yes gene_type:complete
MRRKKILMCTEAHWLPTGYSVYTKEVLRRLSRNPNFEIAELACYVTQEEADTQNVPWRVIGNQPIKNGPDWEIYKSSPSSEFGEFKLNETLIDFMPDFVMDIRDWWMLEFVGRSCFRDFFQWTIMPAVDARPQNKQWIDTYSSADAVFAYSEFGRDVLLGQSSGMNFVDVASPCASPVFCPPENKGEHKKIGGIDPDSFVIGTVMRNQRRKLFPDLFEVFARFLDTSKAKNAYLYCHTAYPDLGWEIPQLLQEHGIGDRVLFTYRCKKCGTITPKIFSDVISHCSHCGSFESQMIGINNKATEEDLSEVYKLFDVYIQYANSEGFGMPQLEATSTGLPLITVDYSAMESVGDNVGAFKVPVLKLHTECETGCLRAIPDNDAAMLYLMRLYSLDREAVVSSGERMRQSTLEKYSWDTTAQKWGDYFSRTPVLDPKKTWLSPSRIFSPAKEIPANLKSIKDQVDFLFTNVLGRPEWIGNYFWKRTVRDLTYKSTMASTSVDFHFSESHTGSHDVRAWSRFTLEDAHRSFLRAAEVNNQWERYRLEKIQAMMSGGLNR